MDDQPYHMANSDTAEWRFWSDRLIDSGDTDDQLIAQSRLCLRRSWALLARTDAMVGKRKDDPLSQRPVA